LLAHCRTHLHFFEWAKDTIEASLECMNFEIITQLFVHLTSQYIVYDFDIQLNESFSGDPT